MIKSFYLIGLIILFLLPGCKYEEDNFEFDIWCGCKLNKKSISCYFYAFPDGEYESVERDLDKYGTAYAFLKDGTMVRNIGYAYYNEDERGYATLYDYNNTTGMTPIREGTYYIACFPLKIGYSHPYKAKTFTKTKDKGLVIEPVFTEDSYYGVDGYKFFEWDE